MSWADIKITVPPRLVYISKQSLKIIATLVSAYIALIFILNWGFLHYRFDPFPDIFPDFIFGYIYEGPSYFSNNRAAQRLLDVPQVIAASEEKNQWPIYRDDVAGIELKYPPSLKTVGEDMELGGYGPWTGSYRAVAIHSHDDALPLTSTAAGTMDHAYDRFIIRVIDKQFSRDNVTTTGMISFTDKLTFRWHNPEQITIDGVDGYYIPFNDYPCRYEHYAFPDKTGQKIIKLSFSACLNSKESIRPYQEAILSTVRFTEQQPLRK